MSEVMGRRERALARLQRALAAHLRPGASEADDTELRRALQYAIAWGAIPRPQDLEAVCENGNGTSPPV